MNKWVNGEMVNHDNVNLNQFAKDLATFLKEFQLIDCTGGPIGGTHNFFRGGDLAVYHDETQSALMELSNVVDVKTCIEIWNKAMNTKWTKAPVWVHGDIAPGNLLVENGRLSGIIDFGNLGIGDPSCDLVMAWTFFDNESRLTLMESMILDKDTWDRARGWALWKVQKIINGYTS
ncbi:phosphotransferase [Paenibacillus popilliae]